MLASRDVDKVKNDEEKAFEDVNGKCASGYVAEIFDGTTVLLYDK